MINYSDLRHGTAIELDGEPWQVLEFQHTKMQQRAPVLYLKLRHLKTGRVITRNVPGNQKLSLAPVEQRQAQYLYNDEHLYYFMDMENYDQLPISKDLMRDALPYLKEQAMVGLVFYRDDPVSIELPTFAELRVKETTSGFRGDTAQGGTKSAILETGLSIQVPLFINEGETVRVDTRSGEYLERV